MADFVLGDYSEFYSAVKLISAPMDIFKSESSAVMSTPVRTPLNRCIYVIGPQSTGKTTLVNALVLRFKEEVHVIKEIARSVMTTNGYSREDVDCEDRERRFSFQNDIFLAQVEEEGKLAHRFYVSDRSAIDPLVYLTHYSGESEAHRITAGDVWQDCRARYGNPEKSVIILLLPVENFLADDDIRYMATSVQEWRALGETFRRFLESAGIPFIPIGEELVELEARVNIVLDQMGSEEIERLDQRVTQ
jgi:nicotinamide riboside kinase